MTDRTVATKNLLNYKKQKQNKCGLKRNHEN